MPEARLVFLAPPSWEELVRRLTARGSETPAEREVRLRTARIELDAEREFDATIVNDDVQQAAQDLVNLMSSSSSDDSTAPNL
jgi:guanylate kinase